MKSKKYLFSFLCFIIIMSVLIIPVNALNTTFSMTTDYDNLKIGDTFDVVVAINNITDKTGIILVEYNIDFDPKCFEIVKWEHNKPEIWGNDFLDGTTVIEKDGNKSFVSSYLYNGDDLGHGVLENDILFSTITFKVLSDNADEKKLFLNNTSFLNDKTQDFYCNKASILVYLQSKPVMSQEDLNISVNEISNNNKNNSDSSIESDDEKINESSFDDYSIGHNVNINSILKISIAVIAIIIIILVALYINKRIKVRK